MINVLVAEDSAFRRRAIAAALESDPEIRVIDSALDRPRNVSKTAETRPDVVIIDTEAPAASQARLEILRLVTERENVPVIALAARTRDGDKSALKALEEGAIDVCARTNSPFAASTMKFEQQLISKVRAAARCNHAARIRRTDERIESAAPWTPLRGNSGVEIVAIAASSGGTTALRDVVRRLPADFPAAVLIIHHTNAAFSGSLAEWLDSPTGIQVKEAESGDRIESGLALVAPGERHMTVRRSGGENYAVLSAHPREYLYRPSIDLLFASVGEVFRRSAIGVVLSGAGNDGFEGAKIIRGNGGTVIAQEPSSSVIPDMPEAIVVAGVADVVAHPDSIPQALFELVGAECPRK